MQSPLYTKHCLSCGAPWESEGLVSAVCNACQNRSKILTEKSSKEGVKFDSDKLPLELLPVSALKEVARVLQHGAKKYGRNNWRQGISDSRLMGAALRHLFSYIEGEELDPETKCNHLAHAACEILFMLEFDVDPKMDVRDESQMKDFYSVGKPEK